MPITAEDVQVVKALLGREPRGLEDIAVRDKKGMPVVIRVASLVDNHPFPTLFWLVDKSINYTIDQLEAQGLIAEFQQQIDRSDELQTQMRADHYAHIKLRESCMTPVVKTQIHSMGYQQVLSHRGIGGIADFQRIRCLHTYYAAHLVCRNTVGTMLDTYWQQKREFLS